MIFRTKNLSVGFAREAVLEVSDIQFKAGDLILIRGENGSGKTTLLRTLAGLQQPVEGGIQWVAPGWSSSIAYLPQDRSLFSQLTVKENLRVLSPRISAMRNRLEELLDRPLEWSTRASRLSGGEARLVAVASLLACRARIVLLDEPFSAISEAHVPRLVQWIDEEVDKGRIFCVVEHRPFAAKDWRGFFVRNGTLLEKRDVRSPVL